MNKDYGDSIRTQALPPGTRVEEFVIERVLGSGGFGITYLAKDTRLYRQVVIKENLPAQFCFRDTHSLTVAPRHTHGADVDNFQWSLENFSKEASMLASLDHPGIVKVLRSFHACGTAYFVMPFVDGVALDELVKQRGGNPFSEEELRGLLERTLSALAYLHERGIYHRDIKPGNILITNEGLPVLIDFGSARQRLSERSMTVVESAGYTPFEQLQSRGNVGPWSDLYALAATMVKVMLGEAPPKANDRGFGDLWQPLTGRADLAGRYSEVFLHCLDRALRLPIEERWQTAGDWNAALVRGVVPKVDSLDKPPAPISSVKVSTKKPSIGLRWSFAAVAFLTVVSGCVWWLTRKDAPVVPAVSPVPLTGGLVITSEPSGAELRSATREVLGKTPVELTGLSAGQPWQGTLAMEGYDTADVKAEVVSGETKLVAPIKLMPQAQKVIVSSEPSDAEVVDGDKVLGRTPLESSSRQVGESVVLTLRKVGYDDAQVSGEVPFGKSLILQGTLKAKPQQVAVESDPNIITKDESIKGDFDGDNNLESMWLTAPQLKDDDMDCVGECVSFIRFSNPNIPEIRLESCIGGVPINEGDLDGDGADEIGILPSWFTSCWRFYKVFTFKNGRWWDAVEPISTHCNQWDAGVKPIEVDLSKLGSVIIHYSEMTDDGEIVIKTKTAMITGSSKIDAPTVGSSPAKYYTIEYKGADGVSLRDSPSGRTIATAYHEPDTLLVAMSDAPVTLDGLSWVHVKVRGWMASRNLQNGDINIAITPEGGGVVTWDGGGNNNDNFIAMRTLESKGSRIAKVYHLSKIAIHATTISGNYEWVQAEVNGWVALQGPKGSMLIKQSVSPP